MNNRELGNILKATETILKELGSLKNGTDSELSLGQRLADKVVGFIGSWKFIIVQSIILTLWIIANGFWLTIGQKWDPYPFILLNLCLSFQAAYSSPIILMAQNRSAERDRRRASDAYKAIARIEHLLTELGNKINKIKIKNGMGDNGKTTRKENK